MRRVPHGADGASHEAEGGGADGLLLIRVWTEQGSTEPLRARVQSTIGLDPVVSSNDVVAGVGDVLEAVRSWLHRVLASES